MKVPALKFGNDATLLAVAIVGLVVVYVIGKKILTGAATVAGGVVSGNNALTNGTAYQGAGVLGTLGAATNSASGGFFNWVGQNVGGGLYDLINGSSTPDAATAVSSAPDDPLGIY